MGGLFGTAVATMGMFCTGIFILSMSGFGPIADNAGGIFYDERTHFFFKKR
jgi:Na+/H+-translocating membrane pyrophosphatase